MSMNRIIHMVAALLLLIFTAGSTQAQSTVRFYDTLMIEVTRDSASIQCEFSPHQSLYICTCYFMQTGKPYSIFVTDEQNLFGKQYGLSLRYYDTGRLEDSTWHYSNGMREKSFHYFESGQLEYAIYYSDNPESSIDSALHYFEDGRLEARYLAKTPVSPEYLYAINDKGEPVTNVSYSEEAKFRGGDNAWGNFLRQNLNPTVPVDNGAPVGTYMVVVRFIVNTDGSLSDINAETKHGYGMEEEVLKLIKSSPKWVPAKRLGKNIKAYRRQPVTFMVAESGPPARN